MFTVKRNQVVVTALAVMIAAAGYLNFQETKSAEGTKTAMELTEEGDMAALMEDDYAALPDDMPTEEGALDPLTAEASTTTGDGAAVMSVKVRKMFAVTACWNCRNVLKRKRPQKP